MTGEIGHFALILALTLSVLQGVLPLYGASRNESRTMATAGPLALGQLLFVGLALAMLTMAYVTSDFSILNVALNSHSEKPLLYKISGVWGNHEGSLLFWVFVLALFGASVALWGRNLPSTLRARVLGIHAWIGTGFYLFILLTSNPFARAWPIPIEGNGLNPLLQDPGLAFHPPTLYIGYVGFSMAFSFAIAALLEGRVNSAWARWVRPWTLAAWIFLTAGIALGSWWAYYELGWGGWWFWDPVENASFMPWLAGTALLHSAVVVEKRDALKSWTILLAILTFSLSLIGTFLVRSGVLISVHAFATDPTRGVFILLLLVLMIGGALLLYALRAHTLRPGGFFEPISREGGLLLNNLFLAVGCGTVLIGTFYPLALDAIAGEKVSVGAPYFNSTFVPLMIPLILAMGAGPFMKWRKTDLLPLLSRLKFAAGVAFSVGIISWAVADRRNALVSLGLALGAWLICSAGVELLERLRFLRGPISDTIRRISSLPHSAWGTALAHAGLGVALFGISASEAWTEESLQIMYRGDVVSVAGYDFELAEVETREGPNYVSLWSTVKVERNGEAFVTLNPETRRYLNPPMETTEAAIHTTMAGDLYVVVGDPRADGGYGTRIYFKPLVMWMWVGASLMVLGGAVSLSDRRYRQRRTSRRLVGQTGEATL